MADTNTSANNSAGQEEFGIGAETKSKNTASLPGGINKVVLTSVKAEEIGKNEKYFVLNFRFVDLEGNKSFTHTEFIPKGESTTKQTADENYKSKREGLNSRLKHIYEAYRPFPTNGIGFGSKNWNEFFANVANNFNTDNEGKPIYQLLKEDKLVNIPVFIKNTYSKKGNLQFPLSPNFIERMRPDSVDPKTLVIDKRYDTVVQPDQTRGTSGPVMGGVVGGASDTSAGDMGF